MAGRGLQAATRKISSHDTFCVYFSTKLHMFGNTYNCTCLSLQFAVPLLPVLPYSKSNVKMQYS